MVGDEKRCKTNSGGAPLVTNSGGPWSSGEAQKQRGARSAKNEHPKNRLTPVGLFFASPGSARQAAGSNLDNG